MAEATSEATPRVESRAADCLAGGGAMGALMRATDWSATALGPVESWPQSLRTTISIMLESKFAMVVAWGPEYRFFYNDRYRPVLGDKHPASLGMPGAEIFPEVWSMVGPEFDRRWSAAGIWRAAGSPSRTARSASRAAASAACSPWSPRPPSVSTASGAWSR